MSFALVAKETPTDFDIHPLIKDRWSPRSFSAEKVNAEGINKLLEAMRWAPSSMNEQPWEVVVAEKGTAKHKVLAASLAAGNLPWASEAPLLMLVLAKTEFGNGAAHHGALYDVGLAVGNLSMEATHLGLSLHQMGGFDKIAVKDSLGLEETLKPVVIIAVGFRGTHENLPEGLQQRELSARKRKKIEEFTKIDLVTT